MCPWHLTSYLNWNDQLCFGSVTKSGPKWHLLGSYLSSIRKVGYFGWYFKKYEEKSGMRVGSQHLHFSFAHTYFRHAVVAGGLPTSSAFLPVISGLAKVVKKLSTPAVGLILTVLHHLVEVVYMSLLGFKAASVTWNRGQETRDNWLFNFQRSTRWFSNYKSRLISRPPVCAVDVKFYTNMTLNDHWMISHDPRIPSKCLTVNGEYYTHQVSSKWRSLN